VRTENQINRKRGEVKEKIIRVLLNYPTGQLSKYRVMQFSEGSQTWVYDYLKQLEDDGYIQNTRVIDIRGLFEVWKKNSTSKLIKNYLVKNPMKLLESAQREYALTTFRAENAVQNYLFPSRTDIYCHKVDKQHWHENLRRSGLVGKGNMRLIYDSDHVFFNAEYINNYKIVSIPQLIVDLLREGGPSVEAAEMLIDKMVSENI